MGEKDFWSASNLEELIRSLSLTSDLTTIRIRLTRGWNKRTKICCGAEEALTILLARCVSARPAGVTGKSVARKFCRGDSISKEIWSHVK